MPTTSTVLEPTPRSRAAATGSTAKWVVRLVALICLLFFLVTGFRAGFQRDETDFPNYYTAAFLVRKRAPLRRFYDWTWFAREMDKAGLGARIGSYTPQTPLSMIPMLGFAGLPPQRAKQAWLILNLFLPAGTLWMLSQITGLRVEYLWLMMFCGYYSLSANFLLGQYYIFLLFLLTLIAYSLHHKRWTSAGIVAGLSFALKLYGGPFLLYFIATRKWKSIAGMFVATVGAVALAIGLFGWSDTRYYVQCLLPRFLEGGAVDPYNVRNQTMPTLLGICFMADPGLNPHPLWNAPSVFFFARTGFSLTILVLLYLGVPKSTRFLADFAWYVTAILLLSTNLSSYTFILLLLPAVLLFDRQRLARSVFLELSCFLLAYPLHFPWLFPKLWLLLGLFVFFGWERWKHLSRRSLAWASAAVFLISGIVTWGRVRTYQDEPGRNSQQLVFDDNSLFSSFPVITSSGLYFQAMGQDRYKVNWLHDSGLESIHAQGNAFHPIPLDDGSSIALEDSKLGTSIFERFDPELRKLIPTEIQSARSDVLPFAKSPDRKWLAYTSEETGFQHLWLRNLTTGRQVRLAGGNCDSSWPTWNLDSQSLVFASDCGRAVGLPALYRAQIPSR